ncbi:putative sulfate/molybdate transporter [Irregularibacter muris]|uniref:Sulfate/molybdate transporter n=1 Tax=Irregularibacter muris TaxID=1796619 RepID=A0AAE3L031_9FIRM|nr:putative sulfate/molybdate transporter [Irregularibacter muris]MCR1899626.1 putative sulfate/molybdate transporter [Irregularibacter muris]
MAKYRQSGEEQPYLSAGIFKIRIPFIHYKWEWSEALQGILMCATCLGAIPIMTDVIGVSFEIAWSMVIINGLLYSLHALLGDPVVPGWITPSIPLTTAFLMNFVEGPERIHVLIALQLLLSIIFLFMGISGGAAKIMNIVPNSVKGGILLGAGISAITGEFTAGGRFGIYPIAITIGAIVSYYILFSEGFRKLKKKNKVAYRFGKYGMLPAIIISIIIGPLAGELPIPQIEVGSIIKIPDFAGIIRTVSPFGVGFPGIDAFIAAIPMAIMVYIIAFGDFVTSEALIGEADEVRMDEKIDFNSNRSNLISGIRNLIMALISPYVPLCGPLWSAVTAAVSERYKEGRKVMDSIFGGVGTFRWSTFICVTLVPIVSLVQPVLPVALALTMLVQGFVCTRLAMNTLTTDTERGVAGVMAAVLAVKGAAWGLAIGIILHVLLIASKKNKDIDLTQVSEVEA